MIDSVRLKIQGVFNFSGTNAKVDFSIIAG